ncbi:nucleobase:cation symporter-2 family protein [Oscillatoria sp. CS-180]|uniref:uracil-xanthine permease family protein n=1 Tax=Oscillatoria sp. CS-180 TaxID=3021720 RepID=UPI00232BECCC|nr:nucleobase:cation symporter-2 family protein [Oscillatoria sp. CS-180]MDB9528791.1 nucleobase:cation symporter-2 family protein [Oscillatoria sp. CS-180]
MDKTTQSSLDGHVLDNGAQSETAAAVEEANHELIYGLEDKPPIQEAIFAAIQHVLACFVGIITPSLIVSGALGLEPADAAYVVSMSLFVSGIATFIQARRIGPVGSGLLSIQGTSFAFIGPILGAGTGAIAAGSSPTEALGLIFGLCFFGAFIEIFCSRFLHLAGKIITPLVTGIVVTLIGLTLINVGITSIGGGFPAREAGTFGSLANLGVGVLVMLVILTLNSTSSSLLRMSSIVIGLIVGYLVAWPLGMVSFGNLSGLSPFALPIPFRYGFSFSFAAFIPFAFLYLITAIESIGDLTATSLLTGQPITGAPYMKRIKGGVLGDGINSLIAACFNTFPNTTFSQNNGVIQLTGIGSRYVGYFIAGIFVLMGLFPIVGGVFQAMPQPVLGGATLIMFGTVAAAGIKILSCVNFTKRASLITAISLGIGLGVTYAPDILDNLPTLAKNVFSSGISAGGITALVLNMVLPGPRE